MDQRKADRTGKSTLVESIQGKAGTNGNQLQDWSELIS